MSDNFMVALEQNQGHAMAMLKEKNKSLFFEKKTHIKTKKIITLYCESSYFTIIYDPCGLGFII